MSKLARPEIKLRDTNRIVIVNYGDTVNKVIGVCKVCDSRMVMKGRDVCHTHKDYENETKM